LVRSGVAPDHPEVKNVTNDFEEVAKDPRFSFLGNVLVGKDISVQELRNRYSAVILAYGAVSDRTMGIEGENLKNVFSARAFVNWYNGHPDFATFTPNLNCEDVVIVGQGNVAIDCARILAKTVDELKTTDIAKHALTALAASKVKRIHVVGRRGHVQAAFTMKELREITRLDDADCIVKAEELDRCRNLQSLKELESQRAKKRLDALLVEVAGSKSESPSAKRREVILRFLLSPSKLIADSEDNTRVGSFEMDITHLEGEPEKQSARITGKKETIRAGMVLRSIGYKSESLPGVPFDSRKSIVKNILGRVISDSGTVETGLYCTGWLKRGPSGIIGTNITDARETVACLLEDKKMGKLDTIEREDKSTSESTTRPIVSLSSLLKTRGKNRQQLVDWNEWLKIDDKERTDGIAVGKPREKIVSVDTMLRVASA
jgi:adrenodoxin-NADP+ reductase